MIKGICFANLLLYMFLLPHEGTCIFIGITDGDAKNHLCSRIERYVEEHVISYNETFLEPKTVWCFKIPPKCIRYSESIRAINKTISVPKTKTVFECCDGYVKKSGTCTAICPHECIHGKCTSPMKCTCDEGWQGPDCSLECDDGWYGEECKMYCTCQNGATCDKKNGFCHCPPGFAGAFCESICPQNSYGKHCQNECNCKNGGVCNLMNNACECPPGYVGKHCEKQCEEETYGTNCLGNCTCNEIATIFCNHVDGKCMCIPGWKGDACSSKCELNTWGDRCSKKCECPSNSVCDHVTGNCSCQPGWHGPLCEEKCQEGYFGKDCKLKCPDCMYLPGTCHHVTGQCSCPAGSRGSNCDLECPEHRYGENCIHECSCSNNSSCDIENGACACLAGWIGENCTIPCPSGSYGLNCSLFCNCTDDYTCNPTDGECICIDLDPSVCSLQKLNEIGTSAVLDEFESSWDILIILLVTSILLGLFLFLSFVLCITTRAKKYRSRLRKEENSSTNVIPKNSSPSLSSFHFMNPNYDTTENSVTLNSKSMPSFTLENNFTEKKEEKEWDLVEDNFGIPDCNTASPLEKKCIEILFGNGLSKNEEKDATRLPEIRYSKTIESITFTEEDTSSQTNSIYADVEYKNEDDCDIPQN